MNYRALSRLTNAVRLAALRLGYFRTVAMLSVIVFAIYRLSQVQQWSSKIPTQIPFAENSLVIGAIVISIGIIVYLLFELSRVAREVRVVERSDAVTDVFTREHGAALIRTEFNRATQGGQHLAVMVLDIDSFKPINLNYGYAAGDKVLALLVERCQSLLRPADTMGRMGDEEFYIVLPNTDILAAHIMAERIRALIEAEPFMLGGVPVPVTASLGVSAIEPEDTPETLIRRADRKLTAAKTEGRNRVR